MGEEKQATENVPLWARLQRAGLFLLFAAVLLIPKTLGLRRRPGLWIGVRVGAAVAGAGLLWAASSSGWNWPAVLFGLLLVLLALLVGRAREGKPVDEQARELGALVVLNGGWFTPPDGKPCPARFYVASDRVHVLDLTHRPLLEIPLAVVGALRVEEAKEAQEAEEAKDCWRLRIEWDGGSAVFSYEGFFAEHLAQVAEATLRSRLRRELPVLR